MGIVTALRLEDSGFRERGVLKRYDAWHPVDAAYQGRVLAGFLGAKVRAPSAMERTDCFDFRLSAH